MRVLTPLLIFAQLVGTDGMETRGQRLVTYPRGFRNRIQFAVWNGDEKDNGGGPPTK